MKKRTLTLLLCFLLLFTLCSGCKKAPTVKPPDDATNDNGVPGNDPGDGMAENDPGTTPEDNNAVPPQLGTTGEDLTADRLLALLGATETDLTTLMGEDAVIGDDADGRSYKKTMYGGDAEIRFATDTDGSINSVIVTVDKDADNAWRSDLSERYGDMVDDTWSSDDSRIRVSESGDTIMYTFSRAAEE